MITDIKKLKELINNRPVIVMLHGKSILGLENVITELKDKNICYVSLNYFDLMEEHILSKIDKSLDIVFDTAGIRIENRKNYNTKRRAPRLKEFFAKPKNNMLLVNKGVIRDLTEEGYEKLIKENSNKILLLDSLGIDLVGVPNSACLLISVLLLARTKKIIICGMDGYTGKPSNSVCTYYKPEQYLQHQKDAFGETDMSHVNGDTINFELMTKNILTAYCNLLEIYGPEIYNCSPDSLIKVFPIINYQQLLEMV